MTIENIKLEIEKISESAKKRKNAWAEKNPLAARETAGNTEMDFMTSEERERLHQLKLSLPSQGEEVAAAKKRIKERIANRKKTKKF